jgi:hypothetical protein
MFEAGPNTELAELMDAPDASVCCVSEAGPSPERDRQIAQALVVGGYPIAIWVRYGGTPGEAAGAHRGGQPGGEVTPPPAVWLGEMLTSNRFPDIMPGILKERGKALGPGGLGWGRAVTLLWDFPQDTPPDFCHHFGQPELNPNPRRARAEGADRE